MGLHPSLKDPQRLSAKRAVLKRGERIKWLMDEKKWDENQSVLGLPKVKVVKVKVSMKGTKEEAEEEGTEQETKEETKTEESGK